MMENGYCETHHEMEGVAMKEGLAVVDYLEVVKIPIPETGNWRVMIGSWIRTKTCCRSTSIPLQLRVFVEESASVGCCMRLL